MVSLIGQMLREEQVMTKDKSFIVLIKNIQPSLKSTQKAQKLLRLSFSHKTHKFPLSREHFLSPFHADSIHVAWLFMKQLTHASTSCIDFPRLSSLRFHRSRKHSAPQHLLSATLNLKAGRKRI